MNPEMLRRESVFLRACRKQVVPYTPVWFMRQAGRYQRFYRALRRRVSFLKLCKASELAAEVTVRACEQTGADAAILFSDILLVLEPMGFGVRYEKGEGPLIEDPLRKPSDIDRLRPCPRGSLGFVMEAARMVRARLRPEIPLIGFAGAPFTLASYMIEGGKARSFDRTRALMRRDPGAWDLLMEKISAAVTGLLKDQVSAGAGALQIFDSWAGCLTRAEYRRYVLPHMKRLIGRLPSGTPVIHFGTGTAPFLKDFSAAGGQVIGVDHRIGLAKARKIIGPRFAVQGNLDPAVLLRTPAAIRLHVRRILDEAGERPGHIFNLGHGVLPGTPESHVRLAMEFVREESARRKSKSFPA